MISIFPRKCRALRSSVPCLGKVGPSLEKVNLCLGKLSHALGKVDLRFGKLNHMLGKIDITLKVVSHMDGRGHPVCLVFFRCHILTFLPRSTLTGRLIHESRSTRDVLPAHPSQLIYKCTMSSLRNTPDDPQPRHFALVEFT